MRVGIDLVKVERFKKMAKTLNSSNRIFTYKEVAYISSKIGKNVVATKKYLPNEYTVAGLYACKEAVLKAFGVGICALIPLNDVEIDHDEWGACVVVLYGLAKKWFDEHKYKKISLNVSHDGEYSTAICIIE